MQTYRHDYQDKDGNPHFIEKTEEEIIDEFYERWCALMIKVGKDSMISKENCINDWVTIHWAYEV